MKVSEVSLEVSLVFMVDLFHENNQWLKVFK